jgi:(5-formylfuran-3-yl)methyl phosphate transaminase
MSNDPSKKFARRAAEIEPFLVMEVLERAQALEREGRAIIHLEVGEPDFATPEVILKAGRDAIDRGETHYTHSLGLAALREAIAGRYGSRYGARVAPDQVLVTMGSSPAFLYIFAALVEHGDEVILGTPHYSCYPNFIRFFGGRMVEVPTDPADGYRLDPDRVRKAITSRTKAIIINSPSNPTGAVLDGARMKAIADLGLPVISDEIYHGLVHEGGAHTILEFTDRAYVIDGFSKRYAMTGWRLGYLICPAEDLRAFQKMQQNFLISANSFVQRAGIAALSKEGDEAVERMRQVYDKRRKLMVELMREVGFGIPVMPQGAFYVFADASRWTDDSYKFAFELLEKAGVGVAPGVDFGQAGKRAVRFSYASSEENIREAARRLGGYLRKR